MAGLSLSTEKIEIETWDFFPARASFTVGNPNPEHVSVELAAEGDGANFVSFSDRSLVLAPNETKIITVRVSAKRGGEFHPVIAVREQALEGEEIGIAAGIRLPVEIHSRAVTGPLLGTTLIFLIAVGMKFFKKRINKN